MLSGANEGRWIRHPADRLNAAMAVVAPTLLFLPFVVDTFNGYEIAYAAAIFLLIGKTNYLLHLHIHRPFSRSRALNLLFDLSMGSVTAMTASNWRIQHLHGHHRGIDVPYRGPHAEKLSNYSVHRALYFTITSLWETFYSPILESFDKGIRANLKLPVNYRWAFCEQMLLILFIVGLLFQQPRLMLVYLLPWYVVTHAITRYVDYLNHYGCDEQSDSPYVRANNSLSRWFNWRTHNFGYHTAHHIRPGAHWTELPDIHQAIENRIPAKHLKTFSWSGLWIPYHVYRSLQNRM